MAGRGNGGTRPRAKNGGGKAEAPDLTEGEMAALDRAAETLIERTRRADEALERAFGEIEATRAHFAGKAGRHSEDTAAGTTE